MFDMNWKWRSISAHLLEMPESLSAAGKLKWQLPPAKQKAAAAIVEHVSEQALAFIPPKPG